MNKNLDLIFQEAEAALLPVFSGFDQVEEATTNRVLDAFSHHRVAARHFAPSTGYGYDDIGRDTLERILADIFRAEQAILRPQLTSGTHTLSVCLFGLLRPGDHLLLATGSPYDTLLGVIGQNKEPGSLMEMGVAVSQVELNAKGALDIPAILMAITDKTRLVFIQRSRGYALRPSLLPGEMAACFQAIKQKRPDVFIMVDNCYGAFVTPDEPSFYGADAVAGSLIKNLGGGLAPTGGYIAGSQRAISLIENRLTAPGVGRETGSYEASYRPFYQGLFLAPHTVNQALKTAALAAKVAQLLDIPALPAYDQTRSDIIQALVLNTRERVIAYCRGLQEAAPVDAFLTPEPWDMPGYADQVIMAAGTFVQGASIELSCDAPMRAPFALYQQGGLSYASGKRAVKNAFHRLLEVPDA